MSFSLSSGIVTSPYSPSTRECDVQWTVLGAAAVAPYDEGRIGEGEAYDGKGTGDFARFTGQDGQAVATALTAAK